MVPSRQDVIRINFSHADYDLVKQNINLIREINAEYGFSTSILGDLQGPKLRVGVVKEGSYLNPGDVLTFTNEKVEGDSTKVYMTYERFPLDVKVGERILIDDGKLVLEVIDTNGKDTVKAKTIQGGPLSSKKGVNLPNTQISLPALTEKDIQDANFILDNEFDWIALSFVRHAQDIIDLKELISNHPNGKLFRTQLFAKLKTEGVKTSMRFLQSVMELSLVIIPKRNFIHSGILPLAISGRVGTGNIVGVAAAIAMGGPGAVFWMWLIAFLGSASAFVEATLGQVYKQESMGNTGERAAYYIEKGLGIKCGIFECNVPWGVKRGIYSNEAGQGTAPHHTLLLACRSKTIPAQQGSCAGIFSYIDTLFVMSCNCIYYLVYGQYNVLGPNDSISCTIFRD
ncbi:hypothetical protein FQR65_LT18249 [Abscondita terminalis]|nr:hypothetical protein FQR65_LT18249 [Abscondita terminalis]